MWLANLGLMLCVLRGLLSALPTNEPPSPRVVCASCSLPPSLCSARNTRGQPHSLGFLCFDSRLRHWLPTLLSSLIAPIPLSRAWSAASTPLMGQSPLCHGGNISRLVTLGATLWGNFGGCQPSIPRAKRVRDRHPRAAWTGAERGFGRSVAHGARPRRCVRTGATHGKC